MAGGFDYSEFKKYRGNYRRMVAMFDLWLRAFLEEQGNKFLATVKLRTPVDTGDLRDHWVAEGLTVVGEDLQWFFVNPMYYATFVEYGHAKPYKSGATQGSPDWVEGRFMMTTSLQKIYEEMPRDFDLEFEQFCRLMGVL